MGLPQPRPLYHQYKQKKCNRLPEKKLGGGEKIHGLELTGTGFKRTLMEWRKKKKTSKLLILNDSPKKPPRFSTQKRKQITFSVAGGGGITDGREKEESVPALL